MFYNPQQLFASSGHFKRLQFLTLKTQFIGRETQFITHPVPFRFKLKLLCIRIKNNCMKKSIIFFSALLGILAIAIIAYKVSNKPAEPKPLPVAKVTTDTVDYVKRGEYLVSSMGCDDCHSPKKMGPQGPELIPELRLSGYQAGQPRQKVTELALKEGWALFGPDLTTAVGPWGQSFAANLTSDETGIGNWTQDQFFKAIREGKSKGLDGSRPLLPPMPWFAYRNLNDHDLKSIFAFLKSTSPVKNLVPAPVSPADLNKPLTKN